MYQHLRRLVKLVYSYGLLAIGAVRWAERRTQQQQHGFRVLIYHRVTEFFPTVNPFTQSMCVSPEFFERQLTYLQHHFRVLSLDEIFYRLDQGKSLPAATLAITFDDGYRDNFTCAFPALKQKNMPATFFLSTDFIGSDRPFWWDELESRIEAARFDDIHRWSQAFFRVPVPRSKTAFYRWLVTTLGRIAEMDYHRFWQQFRARFPALAFPEIDTMSWEDVDTMVREGMGIGSHTWSHAILSRLDERICFKELTESRQILRRRSGIKADWLAYPRGSIEDITDTVANLARQAGYRAGFMNIAGMNSDQTDRFRLRRIPVYGNEPFAAFLCRCYGLI